MVNLMPRTLLLPFVLLCTPAVGLPSKSKPKDALSKVSDFSVGDERALLHHDTGCRHDEAWGVRRRRRNAGSTAKQDAKSSGDKGGKDGEGGKGGEALTVGAKTTEAPTTTTMKASTIGATTIEAPTTTTMKEWSIEIMAPNLTFSVDEAMRTRMDQEVSDAIEVLKGGFSRFSKVEEIIYAYAEDRALQRHRDPGVNQSAGDSGGSGAVGAIVTVVGQGHGEGLDRQQAQDNALKVAQDTLSLAYKLSSDMLLSSGANKALCLEWDRSGGRLRMAECSPSSHGQQLRLDGPNVKWADVEDELCMQAVSGTQIEMHICDGQETQMWFIDDAGNVKLAIRPTSCLTSPDSEGLAASVSPCRGGNEQLWTFAAGTLKSRRSLSCMAFGSDATLYVSNDCHGRSNELFYIDAVGRLKVKFDDDLCADAPSSAHGEVTMEACVDGDKRQAWSWDKDGRLRSEQSMSALCIDMNPETGRILVEGCNLQASQKWSWSDSDKVTAVKKSAADVRKAADDLRKAWENVVGRGADFSEVKGDLEFQIRLGDEKGIEAAAEKVAVFVLGRSSRMMLNVADVQLRLDGELLDTAQVSGDRNVIAEQTQHVEASRQLQEVAEEGVSIADSMQRLQEEKAFGSQAAQEKTAAEIEVAETEFDKAAEKSAELIQNEAKEVVLNNFQLAADILKSQMSSPKTCLGWVNGGFDNPFRTEPCADRAHFRWSFDGERFFSEKAGSSLYLTFDPMTPSRIAMSKSNGGNEQRWFIDPAGRFKTKADLTLCLTFDVGNQIVTLSRCSGRIEQVWDFDDGYLISRHGIRCMDFGADDNIYVSEECMGHPNQLFYFDPYLRLKVRSDDTKCVSVSVNGNVSLSPCDSYDEQKWVLDDSLRLRTKFDGRCLDIDENSLNVEVKPCATPGSEGEKNQRWEWHHASSVADTFSKALEVVQDSDQLKANDSAPDLGNLAKEFGADGGSGGAVGADAGAGVVAGGAAVAHQAGGSGSYIPGSNLGGYTGPGKTDYSYFGCRELADSTPAVSETNDPLDMTIERCFSICREASARYFGIASGSKCWCAPLFLGSRLARNRCDEKCSGNADEKCGGVAGASSTYVMFDCSPKTEEERQKEAKQHRDRVVSSYAERKGQTCGQDKDSLTKIATSEQMTGSVEECKVACWEAPGSMMCHGFTYQEDRSLCTFYADVASGEPDPNTKAACYWKVW